MVEASIQGACEQWLDEVTCAIIWRSLSGSLELCAPAAACRSRQLLGRHA
jgi:hypothetical protein